MIHWRIQGGGQSGHVRFVSGSLQYIICYYTCRITKSVVITDVFSVVKFVINAPIHAGGLIALPQTHCWTKGREKEAR